MREAARARLSRSCSSRTIFSAVVELCTRAILVERGTRAVRRPSRRSGRGNSGAPGADPNRIGANNPTPMGIRITDVQLLQADGRLFAAVPQRTSDDGCRCTITRATGSSAPTSPIDIHGVDGILLARASTRAWTELRARHARRRRPRRARHPPSWPCLPGCLHDLGRHSRMPREISSSRSSERAYPFSVVSERRDFRSVSISSIIGAMTPGLDARSPGETDGLPPVACAPATPDGCDRGRRWSTHMIGGRRGPG